MRHRFDSSRFHPYKDYYDIYGTHTEKDKYKNEYIVRNENPKFQVYVMWQPLTDEVSIAEYGEDIDKMYYCIIYDDYDFQHNDIVILKGDEYEVVGIKLFNTYTRIDVKRKTAQK